MADERQENRIIQSLLWLMGSIVAGLGISRYLGPPAYSGVTIAGGILTGMVLAGLVYLRGGNLQTKAPLSEVSATRKKRTAADESKALQRVSRSNAFLVIHVLRQDGDAAREISASFLGSVSAGSGVNTFLDAGSLPSSPGQPSTWTLKSEHGNVAEFIEIPFLAGNIADASALLDRVCKNLGLTGRWSRFKELARGVFSGRVPTHLGRLNGVVLCVPLTELRRDTETASLEALNCVSRATQSKYPLYVIVTGLELLAGFAETASILGATQPDLLEEPVGVFFSKVPSLEELRQALGSVVEGFAAWLPSVLFRLNESIESTVKRLDQAKQNTWRLHQLEEQRKLVEFSPQLDSFSSKLASKLNIFSTRGGPTQAGPILRGILFSGLVFESPQDLDDVQRSYSLVLKTQRAFVAKFITSVLPLERAGSARHLSESAKFGWLGFYRSLTLAVAILLIFTTASAVMNWRLVRQASVLAQRIVQLEPTTKDPGSMDRALEEMDELGNRLAATVGSAWYEHFGFYQGDQVRARLQVTYEASLQRWLIPPVLSSLEARMRGIPLLIEGGQELSLADAVRLYSMFYHRQGCMINRELLAGRSAAIWVANTPADTRSRLSTRAYRHYSYVAELLSSGQEMKVKLPKPQEELLAQARSQLGHSRGFKDVFSEILQQANRNQVEFTEILSESPERAKQLGEAHTLAISGPREVPAAFTLASWPKTVKALGLWESRLGLDACLGTSGQMTARASTEDPYGDYAKAYIKQWQSFLNDNHVKQDFSVQTASGRLKVLYGEHSPLLAILAFVSHNSVLPATTNAADRNDPSTSAAQQIVSAFQPVQKIASAGSDRWSGGWWTDEYRKHLVEVQTAMEDVASHPSDHSAKKAAKNKSSDAIRVIESEKFPGGADGVAESVKALLKAPFQRVLQLTDEDPSAKANGMLKGFCRDLTSLQSKSDVTEAEFDRVFDPRIGSFFQFQRSGLVRRDESGSWVAGTDAQGLVFNDQFLTFLGQVSKLDERLYQKDHGLGFDFFLTIKPYPIDNSTQVLIGNQAAVPEGTSGKLKARWPGSEPSAGFILKTKGGGLSYKGFLGLFQMIGKADEVRAERNQIVVQHPKGGNGILNDAVEITFQDLPGGLHGPLSGLTCPATAAHK